MSCTRAFVAIQVVLRTDGSQFRAVQSSSENCCESFGSRLWLEVAAMPPKKIGCAKSDGCEYLDESASRCRRTTTNARTDGNWLCPLHAALAREESPPRMGRRTRARRLVHMPLNIRRRLRGKQKPPRRGQQVEACTHEDTEPCSKQARASVAGKRYCKAHAAASLAAMPAWEVAAHAEFEYLMNLS